MTDETRAKLILQQLPSEIKVYFAMIILSGCNVLPRRKMYWENKPDFFIVHQCQTQCFEIVLIK